MRTTIDMPDALMKRVKTVAAQRKTTFRALVVDALERTLDEKAGRFQLEDASVGSPFAGKAGVPNEAINEAINEQRTQPFSP